MLSSPIENIKDSYEVVVVGSGYGGGIAASRLSRAGRKVCVLERGREIEPGQYPSTAVQLLREVQTDLPITRFGPPTALFDIRYNADINVVAGCGLGGTSLINAGIALRPDVRIFDDKIWPVEIRSEQSMDRYFALAEEMLVPSLYPERDPPLPKFAALQVCAEGLREEFRRAPILVNFRELENGVNHVGVGQRPCVDCGDCVSGCNHHAKNTLLMNYLPDASNHGAEIYTEVCVRSVERQGGRWIVHCVGSSDQQARTISANFVVLAAGTLGSTEILLRVAQSGQTFSPTLGRRFSANGDMVGFAYNGERVIRAVGLGDRLPDPREPVGPCSTGMIDARKNRDVSKGMIMVDGTIPGAVSSLLPAFLGAAAKLTGTNTETAIRGRVEEVGREVESTLLGAYTGALNNTLTYLVVSQDDSGGHMYLDGDRLRISWPGLGLQSQFAEAGELMKTATAVLGGTYVPNPVWNEFTNHNLVTGHPLGGCAMADQAEAGTVNHRGQVYANASGSAVYQNLYVMDGSVIPRSLGVNPLLTISALAERSCDLLARDQGWSIDYALP